MGNDLNQDARTRTPQAPLPAPRGWRGWRGLQALAPARQGRFPRWDVGDGLDGDWTQLGETNKGPRNSMKQK